LGRKWGKETGEKERKGMRGMRKLDKKEKNSKEKLGGNKGRGRGAEKGGERREEGKE